MKTALYNIKGEQIGDIELPEKVFNIPLNHDLIQQVSVSQSANRRQVIAHTKTRGEVRGGGRKPWRQKGTGRARHGSTRSPIWVGGGTTFGPRNERVFEQKINKKMRRKALFAVLSEKARRNMLLVVDGFGFEKPKAKQLQGALQSLPCNSKKTLIALPSLQKELILSARNLSNVQTIQAKDLNALDLLSYKYLILPKESISIIEQTFAK